MLRHPADDVALGNDPMSCERSPTRQNPPVSAVAGPTRNNFISACLSAPIGPDTALKRPHDPTSGSSNPSELVGITCFGVLFTLFIALPLKSVTFPRRRARIGSLFSFYFGVNLRLVLYCLPTGNFAGGFCPVVRGSSRAPVVQYKTQPRRLVAITLLVTFIFKRTPHRCHRQRWSTRSDTGVVHSAGRLQ
jgi:hypothetical protein